MNPPPDQPPLTPEQQAELDRAWREMSTPPPAPAPPAPPPPPPDDEQVFIVTIEGKTREHKTYPPTIMTARSGAAAERYVRETHGGAVKALAWRVTDKALKCMGYYRCQITVVRGFGR